MFSAAVISCVFWFTEDCHVSVLQEMDVPGIGEIGEVSTFETAYGIEPMANKVEHNSSSPDASPDSYYNSFFGIDLQIVQNFFFVPENKHFDEKVNFQPNAAANNIKQDDVDVRMAQKYFKEMMGGKSVSQEREDIDVQMARKYFKQMLDDGQRTTTTSSSFLSKFDRFDGKACSLGKHEPLASFEVSVAKSNFDPSTCARACLGVSDCTGFQILQFHALTYCDLLSTCTQERLQVVPSKGLSTYLLTNGKDATSRPSFDYYYEYESTGGYFIPFMVFFAIICFALAACRVQRRRQLLAARARAAAAAAARKCEIVRGTPVNTHKGREPSDSEIIVIGSPAPSDSEMDF